jgi:CO/xanthine dehydrogenase Mo-binding subunit
VSVNIPKSLDELPTSQVRYISQPVERLEDPSLLTGRTDFIDNLTLPGMLHCAILRSPYAHARITMHRHARRSRRRAWSL